MTYAIEVLGVTKVFPPSAVERPTLKATITALPRKIFAKGEQRQLRYGLRNLSFAVRKGELVGVIGKNGSGKSTLAKLLAGVSYPTMGQVKTQGRVSGLLELGAGFHPELNARENIYLNGLLLGLRKKEIGALVDEILDFAGLVERQADPIRTYSTGMQMRLGFAIATHVAADVLIIDEALSVGDDEFQRKCNRHLAALRKRGTTMIVITHDMGFVREQCSRALWIQNGTLMLDGRSTEVVAAYLAHEAS